VNDHESGLIVVADDAVAIRGAARRAAIKGFAVGVVAALLGTLLVTTALGARRGANGARTQTAAAPQVGNAGSIGQPKLASFESTAPIAGQPQHEADPLPPETAAQATALRARLTANPADLSAAKQLAFLLLVNGQFVDAFEHSKTILELSPDDPDGLYVQGVVRTRMGQTGQAIELLDRVLAQYPDHLLALTARGTALQKAGDTAAAIASWESALAVAGGRHPEIERLLQEARGGTQEELLAFVSTLASSEGER
jgi:Flp pilus assembly protein TadD